MITPNENACLKILLTKVLHTFTSMATPPTSVLSFQGICRIFFLFSYNKCVCAYACFYISDILNESTISYDPLVHAREYTYHVYNLVARCQCYNHVGHTHMCHLLYDHMALNPTQSRVMLITKSIGQTSYDSIYTNPQSHNFVILDFSSNSTHLRVLSLRLCTTTSSSPLPKVLQLVSHPVILDQYP